MVKKVFLKDDNIKLINEFLTEKVHPYLVYLFGSSVNGIFRDDSDIDIAFFSDNEFSDYEVFMLAQEIADIVRRDVDLINLKKASTVFKAQIVGSGEVIYCTDDKRRMYFEMYAFKEYARLNEERAGILERIKRERTVYGD